MDTTQDRSESGVSRDRPRMTLDLSRRLSAELERIAEENEMTKSDVLRLALELLASAHEAKKEGLKVGAWLDNPSAGVRKEREFIGKL